MSSEIFSSGAIVNKALLELAENAVKNVGDGKIFLEDAKVLIEKMKEIEGKSEDFFYSIEYIEKHYSWTNMARKWFEKEYSKMGRSSKVF